MRSSGTLLADVGEAVVHEVPDEAVDDAVVAVSPVLPGSHEPHAAQERELMAHRRHRQAEGVGEIADAELVVRERVYESKSQRVREGVKDLHRFGDHFAGGEAGAHFLDLLGVDHPGERCLHS